MMHFDLVLRGGEVLSGHRLAVAVDLAIRDGRLRQSSRRERPARPGSGRT